MQRFEKLTGLTQFGEKFMSVYTSCFSLPIVTLMSRNS